MSQPIVTMFWALAFVVALGSASLLVVRHDLAVHRAARRRARVPVRLTASGPVPGPEPRRVTT